MRVLAIPGSLREGSYNVALARAAAEYAPYGVSVELYEGLGELPHYDADVDGEDAPASVRDLRRRIAEADALLVVTPEYNGSIPGLLKNAIDWASRPHRALRPLGQDDRDRGSVDGLVRRPLGAERPAARARHRRRTRDRG